MLFFDLLPMARLAHEAADEKLLNRIYGFAEWCFSQPEKELWNAAGVAFYEHLFDEPQHWKEITGRLSLSVMENCWTLWDTRLSVFQLHRLRKLFRERFPEFQPGRESSA
jgi:hypothetical protein